MHIAQLFLRISLSVSFFSAVADRFGLWGNPGEPFVAWGNWENFLAYSASVNSFMPSQVLGILAVSATALEIALPFFLLIGYKTRIAAATSGILLLMFGLAMTFGFSIKAPLDYSVFTASAGAFLLSCIKEYGLSLDKMRASE